MNTQSQPDDEPRGSRSKKPDICGHRARMRDKVLGKSAESLTELELLEMLLYQSNPRGDTKPIAKRLMRRFRTLAGVLCAPVKKLQEVEQVGLATIVAIKFTEAAVLHLSHSRTKNQRMLGNWMHV